MNKDIQNQPPMPKSAAEEYGEQIEKLSVTTDETPASILISKDDRHRVLKYVMRKYGDSRSYTTRTVEGKLRLYRTK